MPVLEAMACGCPVVTTTASSLAEVGGEAARYAHDSTPEGLLDALETLLYNTSAMLEAKGKGLARAALFSWDATARETLAGYKSIVEEFGS